MFMLDHEDICEECENPINECACGFDLISNVPDFIHRRSLRIFTQQRCKITELRWVSIFFNYLFDTLPYVYSTRTGHEVEEFAGHTHSNDDAARFLGSLIIRELNSIIINLSTGTYNSTIKDTRAVFEWMLRIIVLLTNRELISQKHIEKNMPNCFHLIVDAYGISNQKSLIDNKTKKQIEKKIKNQLQKNEIEWNQAMLLLSNIGTGIGKQISSCDDDLLKYIDISPFNENSNNKKQILRQLYSSLSEYVHIDSDKIYEIEPGGVQIFYDSGSFESTYKLIIQSFDIVCYFYLLLLDIDIFHINYNVSLESCYERKMRWRKDVQMNFDYLFISNLHFLSTRKLLNSNEWNSNPPKELMNLIMPECKRDFL